MPPIVAARKFTAGQSQADRAAQLERIKYQLEEGYKNDRELLDARIAQEKLEFSQKREDEQRETLISLVNQAIDSDTYQTILRNEIDDDAREAKEKEIRARLTSEFRKLLVGDKYKITKRSP